MTGSGDESSGADGDDDSEQDKDLDELQPVSTSLWSAQHRKRGTGASAHAAGDDREDSEQSDPDAPEADLDGLNEPAAVASSLRSAQSRVSGDDDPDDDRVSERGPADTGGGG